MTEYYSDLISELLKPLLEKEQRSDDPEYRGWSSVAELKNALAIYQSHLAVCIVGYSAYRYADTSIKPPLDGMPGMVEIGVTVIPGCQHHGQGTPVPTAKDREDFLNKNKLPENATLLQMIFIEPTFSARTVGDLHEYTSGLTVGDLLLQLDRYEDDSCVCISGVDRYEIVRLRQLNLSEQNPTVLEIEIADLKSDRELQIFGF